MPYTEYGGLGPNSNPNASHWKTTVSISAGTDSGAFPIPGELGFIIVDTVDSGTPTLTFQVTDDDAGWTDTAITATGSTTVKQLITSDTVASVAGLCGHGGRFRWFSSASVTVNIYHYSIIQ